MTLPERPEGPSAFVAPIFPIAMSVAWILEGFASSGDPLPHLWRPLLITTLAVAAITGVAWVAGRRRPLPLLMVGLVLLLFLKAWPLLGALLAGVVWRAVLDVNRRRSRRPPMATPAVLQVVNLANTVGLVLLVVAVSSVSLSGVDAFLPQAAARGTPTASAPNIYFVLLDGYPRQDSLKALGIDNGAFIRELEGRGFSVARRSHTNYHDTTLTLTSMLNGRYLSALPELAQRPGDRPAEYRLVHRALDRARLLDDLREHGSVIINSPSVFGPATVFSADVSMSSGGINHFDHRLLSRTFLGEVLSILSPSLVDSWLRDAVLAPMRNVEAVAGSDSGSPHFMLAHVLSPHPPFLFDAAGALPHVQACYASGCSLWTTDLQVLGITPAQYADLLAEQIQFLNDKLVEMVDRLAVEDPDAAVILFGDHGIRFDAGVSVEYFRNFFAARTPGQEDLFPDDVSPVNVVVTLEIAYLGTTFPIRDYEAWESRGGRLLDLARWLPDPT
jgi:hypothetical protein